MHPPPPPPRDSEAPTVDAPQAPIADTSEHAPSVVDPADGPAASQHHSLKYHLLGPSLTKAGQDTVDQKKVSEVIYEASKGSKFFNNEEAKDRNLTERINRILARKRQLERLDIRQDLRRADDFITELELSRDLSQTVVHLDCDAFYAAVEELDRPELKNVPFAVGKGVLCTCNYEARKFGCRSGMAGFVAKKLCPQLICLPLNFDKYTAKAEEVREILAEYDPRFESASIDEAYLNITEYCMRHGMDPVDAVSQLRAEIHEKTKITVSAGIAANAKLAKICSNKNKPNGQFRLPNERGAIMSFMRDLPTRKVNGIGRVLERELDAIGVKTCGDIYDQRGYLFKLFGEKSFQFLMGCYLGLGRTKIQPAEEYERKSVGTESTFRDLSGPNLHDKLRHTAEELERDLERTQYKGRTLVLKIKLHTYEVYTRQVVPPMAVCKADDLYKYSLPMLTKLEKEIPNMTLRLMGLRVTNLVSTKKAGIDFFGVNKRTSGSHKATEKAKHDDEEWEVWPEAEFEQAARQELQDEMNELEALSQEHERRLREEDRSVSKEIPHHGRIPNSGRPKEEPASSPKEEFWDCPICARPQPADDRTFNGHIDFCLSRQTIKEAIKDGKEHSPSPEMAIPPKSAQQKKRGRPRGNGASGGEPSQKRLFFQTSSS